MSKKDYELIAEVIQDAMEMRDTTMSLHPQTVTIKYIAKRLATALALDNEKFDTSRFLTACGVQND